MSPRFEIDVPTGQEEAFRQLVETFPDARILFDESKYRSKREKQDSWIREQIARLLREKPVEEEERLIQRYQHLFNEVYANYEREAILRATTAERLREIRRRFHEVVSPRLEERHEIVLAERYGLIDNQPKTLKQVGALLHIGASTAGGMNRLAIAILRHPDVRNQLNGTVVDIRKKRTLYRVK